MCLYALTGNCRCLQKLQVHTENLGINAKTDKAKVFSRAVDFNYMHTHIHSHTSDLYIPADQLLLGDIMNYWMMPLT